ncbi:C6 transcription factor [Fonsecaea pedrosoi]|nr:C6 transcription factor [Fonsecaea pedrosoi]
MATFSSRDPELLLSILALVSRFEMGNPVVSDADLVRMFERWASQARELIMRRVTYGPVELSTIQALCLLSLGEFNHGNTPRASTYIALATDLVSSSGLSSDHGRPDYDRVDDERRRCFWSVVLLRNLYGVSTGTFSAVRDERTPRFPQRPDPPAGTSSQMTDAALEQRSSSNEPSDLGIFARGSTSTLPAWSPQSEYSQITADLMELETRLPYKYRFRPSRFQNQNYDQLEKHRDFWAPWIMLQLLYHTILCLLNHPLLLFLRLRNFRLTMVPEVFLQHTADLNETHTEWILHLLDLSIAATIYLQQSFSDDTEVKAAKERGFRKCVSFIRGLGTCWPYIGQLVGKIEAFEKVVSDSFHDSASQRSPDTRIFIDLSLFWEIIESSFVGELPKDADVYFGASLTSHRQSSSSGEVLRSHLLPKPTRLNHHSTTSAGLATALPPRDTIRDSEGRNVDFMNEGVSILAQSYFAQGQDLAGSLDDWWLSGHQS